ncbi:hypothetical protein ABW19_dt0205860 [Dactylella cylindrospora]|nr:hypothetical protein ABW19_dt0205860 [Dactylella cylindrospora]
MSSSEVSCDHAELLLKEFCPPLDSAIVIAISHDFDSIDDARAVLESLKIETIADEADASEAGPSDWGGNIFSDEETDTTQTSASKSANSEKGSADAETPAVQQLILMFPDLKLFTLKHTLDKCSGDTGRAIDELLNRSFLEGEGEGGKGIDGFSEDSMIPAKRKGKKKGKNMQQIGSIWEEIDAAAPGGNGPPSKWEQMQSEISYLSTKLNVPLAAATSVYHKQGSLSSALVTLIETYGEGNIKPEDALHVETINSIMAKHPRLLQSHVTGLVKLCKDDIAAAYKFSEVLNRRQLRKIATNNQSGGQTPLSPISPTTPTSSSEDPWRTASSKRNPLSPKSPMTPTSPESPIRPVMSYRVAAQAAQESADARHEYYNKAAAAYRRSKSDHLMGAVATYYAEEGKGHGTRFKAYSDMAAEALVDGNSSEYTLDLHGVTVQQAIKITTERVTDWWVKTNNTDQNVITPFHIITGIGSHSKNGESRLGPAVSKALVKGNWKIEVKHGHIRVLGVQKPAVKRK